MLPHINLRLADQQHALRLADQQHARGLCSSILSARLNT